MAASKPAASEMSRVGAVGGGGEGSGGAGGGRLGGLHSGYLERSAQSVFRKAELLLKATAV